MKEKADAADPVWIRPFRREGEINFIVVFAHKKQWYCPALDYSRNEKREDSTLSRDSRKLPYVLGWYLPVYAKVLLHFAGNSSKV